jgi:hypothetical protein
LSVVKRVADLEAVAPAVGKTGASRSTLAWMRPRFSRVRRWAKAALGGCHRLSGMRRKGAPHGQHFQDDTESRRALQH